MATHNNAGPAEAIDLSDPGDEVQRRFRYQINYTALKALQLLRAAPVLRAIYCEQVEDLLIEQVTGLFIGVQIKTRELDQQPFKASDASIVNALSRFCVRDAQFPNHFERFVLATNFVFYQGAAPDDLQKLLACTRDNPGLNGVGPRDKTRKYLSEIAQRIGLPLHAIISTLAKVIVEGRKTGIDQPELEIVHAIAEIDPYSCLPIHKLRHGAVLLRGRIWDASSLAIDGMVLDTHDVASDLSAHLQRLRVAKKRIDGADLEKLLSGASTGEAEAELLAIANFIKRDAMPPGLGRMETKMADGAIPYADIAEMKDDVASLENAFLRWKERSGLRVANERLAHFQRLAMTDARRARTQTQQQAEPYGSEMLANLRRRARATCAAESATMFGCRAEHLLGAAGLLSEECKVWWSEADQVGAADVNAP